MAEAALPSHAPPTRWIALAVALIWCWHAKGRSSRRQDRTGEHPGAPARSYGVVVPRCMVSGERGGCAVSAGLAVRWERDARGLCQPANQCHTRAGTSRISVVSLHLSEQRPIGTAAYRYHLRKQYRRHQLADLVAVRTFAGANRLDIVSPDMGGASRRSHVPCENVSSRGNNRWRLPILRIPGLDHRSNARTVGGAR